MRKSRFNEEQIIGVLKESEAGVATELCRKHGIVAQTLYRWKGKYGGGSKRGEAIACAAGENR